MKNTKPRCAWVTTDPIYIKYHDTEWGRPVYDDRVLFEFLILEGAQAGLNWLTVLKKRESYRKCFSNFNPKIIAKYDAHKFAELMNNPGIIRNKLKIKSAITNAQMFLNIQKEFGSFSDYLWEFVNHKPVKNNWKSIKHVPATSPISDKLSKDLKKRGFKFVGSTICYAYMQAIGMVDDHAINCFVSHS